MSWLLFSADPSLARRRIGLRPKICALAWILLVAWAGLLVGVAADPGEVARQVVNEGGYSQRVYVQPGDGVQPKLVIGEEGAASRPMEERRQDMGINPGRIPENAGSSGREIERPGPALPLGKILLVLLIGGFVILLAVAVLQRREGRNPARGRSLAQAVSADDEVQSEAGGVAGQSEGGTDPDALAAEGRLEEALAALLWRGLSAVGWRPDSEGRSQTAREVVMSLGLADPRRRALREIVRIVEVVRFGGATPSEADYKAVKGWLRQLGTESEALG